MRPHIELFSCCCSESTRRSHSRRTSIRLTEPRREWRLDNSKQTSAKSTSVVWLAAVQHFRARFHEVRLCCQLQLASRGRGARVHVLHCGSLRTARILLPPSPRLSPSNASLILSAGHHAGTHAPQRSPHFSLESRESCIMTPRNCRSGVLSGAC